ncbi:hypothetical protein BGZ76_001576 [Entomortierella beljakovae]|nr:hypothetical protein BGZ76_001576 [Entomortierella beljakovae]
MDVISVNNNNNDSNKDSIDQGLEHDPLPPAVDFSGVKPNARYQFRALSRRALSYHRRQRITNIVCLVLWPILLVVLSLALSKLGTIGVNSNNYYQGDIQLCVNDIDYNENVAFELSLVNKPRGGAPGPVNTSWYPESFISNEFLYSPNLPCVRWFGESYPFKAPYQSANAEALSHPDSKFMPPPAYGWFDLDKAVDEHKEKYPISMNQGVKYGFPFLLAGQKNFNQSFYYYAANDQIAQALGTVPNLTRSFALEKWPPAANSSIVYNTSAPGVSPGTGLFGAIPTRYSDYYDLVMGDSGISSSRIFTSQSYTPIKDRESLDNTLYELLKTLKTERGFEKMMKHIPFGTVVFDVLDPATGNIKATLQFGKPPIPDSYEGLNPSSGIRQIITMSSFSSAIVKTKYAGKYILNQGIRALPFVFNTNTLKGVQLNQASMILFPFGLSFLLPTFVSILVQEKEDRHRVMMAMNGLKSGSYFLAHYLEFMSMQLILSLFFCLAATAIGSQLIHKTNPLIIVVLLVFWAHVQVCLAFFATSFFSKTRRATLVVYFLVAVSCIMAGSADRIFKDGIPIPWFIHPTFSFSNIISRAIVQASQVNGLYPMTWDDLVSGSQMLVCLMLLLGESILFLILAFYLEAILPSEYGVQKPWHFPISFLFKGSRRSGSKDPENNLSSSQHSSSAKSKGIKGDDDILEGADADVYAERERVRSQYDPEVTPLIIQNLYHRYPGKVEPALHGMTFGVENNTVLGLLGPNGAGKSTMIHLLTGLYRPSSGTAYVAGANIRTDMGIVHSKIGVCPQHDILWGDLTIADHLLFYSRLRGIPPHLEQQAITYAIASVSLTKFRDRQVKGLSGGEKRRVSIAIALLGDSSVIFLDEPSTGLDPAVRRVIWDVINRVKVNRTIVLTTHSMEEADILSDRIAIMTMGRLRCIGSSLHLKELYGSGFRLNVSSKPGRLQEACESIQTQVLQGYKYRRIDKFTNATTFEFEPDTQNQSGGQLSSIFSALSKVDRLPSIEDWGISQTTLEDVFIRIVTEGDSALAMPSIMMDDTQLTGFANGVCCFAMVLIVVYHFVAVNGKST